MRVPPSVATLTPRSAALAAFCGWLPLAAVNAVFVRLVHVDLDWQRRALHHLYDAGQVLGLAAASWLIVLALWRLPPRARVGVFVALALVAHYGLLGADLDSFLERHPDGQLPFRFLFALAATVGLCAAIALGGWLAPRARLRWLGVGLGLAVAVGNHLVLLLDYPGTHFILAWSAASLIGASSSQWLAGIALARTAVLATCIASCIAGLLSFVVVPGPVVRSALLGSSGAVAAPFVTRVWTRLQPGSDPIIGPREAEWFKPRRGLPAIPPEALPGAPRAPIVILLTIDALRNDVIEGKQYKKSVPAFREMAKRSLRFSRVWSPAAYTMGSLRSLFLGTYHAQHVRSGPQGPRLAELLEQHHVRTLNLRTLSKLAADRSVTKGFGEERTFDERATSRVVVDKVLRRLDERKGERLFIYSHIFDPHSPYTLGGRRGSQKDRYVAEVSYVDRQLGRLRREIAKRRLNDSTYLIVTADHAEAFGEHGRNFHATTVYEEMIRIPLYIEGPGITPRRVKRSVSLIDLGPTIFSLFGVATPAHFLGQSLVPFMRGENPRLTRPLAVDGARKIRALLIEDRWKAIVDVAHGTEELYDLKKDPREQRNLAEEPYARPYFAKLQAFFAVLQAEGD